MNNLEKKIKIKLTTLVEGRLNEQPIPVVDDIAALVTKYGPKIINLFGDDMIKAAEINLGDDAVKLLARTIDDATLLTVKNGEKALILSSGKNSIPISRITRALDKINRNPEQYETIVSKFKDLQLKNGTYVRDLFKRTPKPVPKPPTAAEILKQKAAKLSNKYKNVKNKINTNEFVRGFNSKNSAIKWLTNIPKFGNKLQRLSWGDRGNIAIWFNTGIPKIGEVRRIFSELNLTNDIIMKSLLNVSGQIVGRWWYWTWKIAAFDFFKQLIIDWGADEIIYEDIAEGFWQRFLNAWSWSGLHYIIAANVVYDNIWPYVKVIIQGSGGKQVVKKGDAIRKIDELINGCKSSLQKIEKWLASEEAKKQIKKKSEDVINKVDSTVAKLDTSGILSDRYKQKSTSQDTTQTQQPQQTREKPKPKFVDPFEN